MSGKVFYPKLKTMNNELRTMYYEQRLSAVASAEAETLFNQQWMIMQNKPNFRKAKMKLNSYSTKDYENKPRLRTPGKQTQSNPISKWRKPCLTAGTLAQSRGLLTESGQAVI
jgi:hypothetical protein